MRKITSLIKNNFLILLFCSFSIHLSGQECNIAASFSYSSSQCNPKIKINIFYGSADPGQLNYSWKVDGATIPDSDTDIILSGLDTNGSYPVVVTVTGSNPFCRSVFSTTVNVEGCSGNPSPTPTPTPTTTCPKSNNIFYMNEGGGGLCTTGQASLNNISGDVDYVNWTWALGGYSGTVNNAGTTTPIYYPSGDWTNYYISICATVIFKDGKICRRICKSFLLNCGNGNTFQKNSLSSSIRISPNPTKGSLLVLNNSKNKIRSIKIYDLSGNLHISEKHHNNNVDVSKLPSGVYIIKFETINGVEQKKLIVE